jgi:peroxiredoxin Q/BCP
VVERRFEAGTRRRAALALWSALLAAAIAHAEGLAPGDPAPAFDLRGSDGKNYTLSQFVGKQAVVLAWFPKAFTPG